MGVIVVFVFLLVSCAHMSPLHEASIQGDIARIDKCIAKGIPVNIRDDEGNTPLHYAYYYDCQSAITRLIVYYGADLAIRNIYGTLPLEMAKIAKADKLITSGAILLDKYANWTNRTQARLIYDDLTDMDGEIVIKAIVHQVLKSQFRLQVLFLAIKLGISGTEERLIDILNAFGNKNMAEDYINSGSAKLYEGGKWWGQRHGYYIMTGRGSHRVSWGRF